MPRTTGDRRRKEPQAELTLEASAAPSRAEGEVQAAEAERSSRTAAVRRLTPKSRSGKRAKRQEFFIPVFGLVRLTAPEVELVNHPAFQRLAGVYQLGQTNLVYRGATHRRFEHCLGTLYVAQLMMEAIERNSGPIPPDPDDRVGDWTLGEKLRDEEVTFIRLGALLHDIGHLPAGHTFEDELGLLAPHDADMRLDLVLDRPAWFGEEHRPTLREIIDRAYLEDAAATGLVDPDTGALLTPSQILYLLISKDKVSEPGYELARFRLDVARDIIGNTICADLLDYLHRDWLHVGKPKYFDTRLLEYLEIRAKEEANGQLSRLVINLRGGNKIRTDAVTAILDLLESRYQLFEIALFHRTKLCAAAMLERAVAELASAMPSGQSAFLSELPNLLLDRSDEEMLSFLESQIDEASAGLQPVRDAAKLDRLAGVRALLRGLRARRLHKDVRTVFEYDLAGEALDVVNRFAGPTDVQDRRQRAEMGAKNRLAAARLLEADFGLPSGSVVMYCPPRTMSTKIAEVKILVHRHVHTLDNFERESEDRGVTGGHLTAQKERFRRLWRVLFAIDPNVREKLDAAGLLQAFGRAIDLCVLRIPPSIGTVEEGVRALARELTTVADSPLAGGELNDSIAAREGTILAYPGGAPSLLSCVEPKR